MKNVTNEFKEQILSKSDWQWAKYDGRKKAFRGIDKNEFKNAQERRIHRISIRTPYEKKSRLRLCYECVREWAKPEHGTYQKVVMYGQTWLYLCSPIFGHADYNKSRLMPIKGNERECDFLMKVSKKLQALSDVLTLDLKRI